MPSTVRERPILFSGEMVKALLDGRKTQTRRIIKPQPVKGDLILKTQDALPADKRGMADDLFDAMVRHDLPPHCRYGSPGDYLWVRETWQQSRLVRKGGGERFTVRKPAPGIGDLHYLADHYAGHDGDEPPIWRSSIHMPRWASRITLEITEVRVQRLQDISEEDAQAEGVEPGCLTCGENCIDRGGCGCCRPCYRESFCLLWNKINGPGSWDANPWVWAVSFRPLASATK